MGDGEGGWALEGSPGEGPGGEEARGGDGARKGDAAGQVLWRRAAWARVEALRGGEEAWAGLAGDLTDRLRTSEHLPGTRLFVRCPDNRGQGLRDWHAQRLMEGLGSRHGAPSSRRRLHSNREVSAKAVSTLL